MPRSRGQESLCAQVFMGRFQKAGAALAAGLLRAEGFQKEIVLFAKQKEIKNKYEGIKESLKDI